MKGNSKKIQKHNLPQRSATGNQDQKNQNVMKRRMRIKVKQVGKEKQGDECQEEEQKSLEKIKLSQLKKIDHQNNDFICPICLNYIVQAVSTKCGHTFCEECISEYLLFIKECPICPENLRKTRFGSCIILDQMIHSFVKNNHKEEIDLYEKRVNDNKLWRQNKQVKNLEVGISVDVRDPNFIWKVGTVRKLRIQNDAQKQKYFIIHYDGWSEKDDEEIPEGSPRFAALGFYTGRQDVPKYNRQNKNPFLRQMIVLQSFEDKLQNKDKTLYLEDYDSSYQQE